MDEKVRTQGQMVMGVMLMGISVPLVILAFGFLASYPEALWHIGVLLIFSVVLLFASGLSKIRTARAKEKENGAILARVHAAGINASSTTKESFLNPGLPNLVLVRWKFSEIEWKRFQHAQQDFKLKETILLMLLSAGVFSWALHGETGESWSFCLTFGTLFSIAFFGLKHFLSRNSILVRSNIAGISVVIDQEKVIMNDKIVYFRSEERWLEDAAIEKKKGVTMLEIRYGWKAGGTNTNDSLFVPIPDSKEDEARFVIHHLLKRA